MMRLFCLIFYCLLFCKNIAFVINDDELKSNSDGLVVSLPKLGRLKGSTVQTARTNETIFQFLNVKYAESPSGERRFKVSFLLLF